MNDEELNLALAEAFEPKPSPERFNDSHNWPRVLSKLGMWSYPMQVEHYDSCATKRRGRCDCDASHGLREKRPRDFIHDPAMTVMLLSELAKSKHRTNILLVDGLFTMQAYGDRFIWTAHLMNDFQRAVAVATAKAKGVWRD